MPKTVRQNIIDALYAKLEAMTDDQGGRLWNNVTKDPLDVVNVLQMPAVGLEEGDEETIDVMYPLLNKRLRVFVNFVFAPQIGLDVYDTFNYYLGLLQAALFADKSIGGFAIDIHEVGNSPEFADRQDPRPGGVLMIDVLYRQRNADPYSQ